jgi:hypothetical protein
MSYLVKITNEELYYHKVVDVEIVFHKGDMTGDVVIEVEGEECSRCYSGEHGSHDYEDDFGFIIIKD